MSSGLGGFSGTRVGTAIQGAPKATSVEIDDAASAGEPDTRAGDIGLWGFEIEDADGYVLAFFHVRKG